ncbi:MAG TPA: translation elongation factor-like protein [Candidatus Omnitrophota bacterium]|nr:translation elongation factor-like protein [Candidatus Omnitrophota bacterium]
MQKKSTKKAKPKESNEKEIGEVSTFFTHVGVIAIKLSGALSVGDKIHVMGHTTNFTQKVSSMQIEGRKVEKAKKGEHVGIKVTERARPNDKVFLMK